MNSNSDDAIARSGPHDDQISLDAVIDLNGNILDNSEKSVQVLSLMDRLVAKFDTDDVEDRHETIDACLTLLTVARDLVSEIRDRSEEVEGAVQRLKRQRAASPRTYLTLSTCSHCGLGLDSGGVSH